MRKFSRRLVSKQDSFAPATLERLEERMLLSAAAPIAIAFDASGIFASGGVAVTDAPTIGPVAAPTAPTPVDPVTCPVTPIGVTIHAVAGVQFAGDVGLLKGLSPIVSPMVMTVGGPGPAMWPALTATINWGDNTPVTQGQVVFDSLSIVQVQGTHTYGGAGKFAVTVDVVQDPPAGSLAPSRLYVINSTADVTQNSVGGVTITPTVNQPFTGTVGTFVDSSASPLAGGLSPIAKTFRAAIDWGDGQITIAQVVQDPTVAGQYDVIGTHTYTTVATFHIKIMVTEVLAPPVTPGPTPLGGATGLSFLFTTIDSTAIVQPDATA
jgi:hypothetical protein